MPLPSNMPTFSKDQISKLAAREKPARGYFAFHIVEAEAHEANDPNNYNVMSRIKCRRLADPNDADSGKGQPVTLYVTWPLTNPDDPDHEPPRYGVDQSVGLLSAIFPDEVPDVPRKVNRRLYFRGEEIDKAEETAAREEAIAAAGPKAVEVYADHANTIVGHVFYGTLYYTKKSPDFPAVGDFASGPAQELSTVYTDTGDGDGGGGATAKPNGARGRAKGSSRAKGAKRRRN